MNKYLALTVLALFVSSPSLAATFPFPEADDSFFEISIPKQWNPSQDEDNTLTAASPKEHVHLTAWELEDKDNSKQIEKEIKDALKDHAKQIKFEGEPKMAHPGGLDGQLYQGQAVSKDDGDKIGFIALTVATKERAALILVEFQVELLPQESEQFSAIVKSIKPPEGEKSLHAALAVDDKGSPTTEFASDAAKIYAFFAGDSIEKGDEIRCVWYAEDVGDATPKNAWIDQASYTAPEDNAKGTFSLTKPPKGWPAGKYRAEILVNGEHVLTLAFTIKPAS
jgi:hypothetical protein